MLSKKTEKLVSLRLKNNMLCEEILFLPKIWVGACYLIGATTPDGRLQVKVSKKHLGKKSFSKAKPSVVDPPLTPEQLAGLSAIKEEEIPKILPLVKGASVWMVKCKLTPDIILQNPALMALVSPGIGSVKLTLYGMLEPEDCNDFYDNVREKVGLDYVLLDNFFNKMELLYVRVRGPFRDPFFDELVALRDVARVNADFFVETRGGEWKLAESMRLGAVGGVSEGAVGGVSEGAAGGVSEGAVGGVSEGAVGGVSEGAAGGVSESIMPGSEKLFNLEEEMLKVSTELEQLAISIESMISKDK